MKILTFIISLFFYLTLSGQNWSPINLDNEYNYKIDTSQLITNTISVDSFSVNNNDTIFYLNRIMKDCDTCSVTGFKLINQPQFLMRQVLKNGDSLFIFQDYGEFRIYPMKSLGDSWIFDSTNGISAFIDSVYIDTIFGINDSIKSISLSNGNKIILSKSFGIIHYPINSILNYSLIGLKSDSTYGKQIPKFWDFFNYDVNDILQWKYYNFCGHSFRLTKYSKATIISKTINNDSVYYQVQGVEKVVDEDYISGLGGWISQTIINPINTTLTFIDSTFHYSNSYQNQAFAYRPISSNFYTMSVLYQENGLQKKSIDFSTSYWNIYPANDFDPLKPIYNPPNYKTTLFTEGLGVCTYELYGGSTCGIEECMQGRIHLGDTIGFVYPDSFYVVGIEEINNYFNIYPNPVSENIIITSTNNLNINQIRIIDLTGKIVKYISSNLSSISVKELPQGIYFIQLLTEEKVLTKKFIKQ